MGRHLAGALLLFAVVHTAAAQGPDDPRTIARGVMASDLDPKLPRVPVADWLRELVQPDLEMQWGATDCPATNQPRIEDPSQAPVCVMLSAGRGVSPGHERPGYPGSDGLVVVISIRLGTGFPWGDARWKRTRAEVEDLFIERDRDSLSVQRLSDLPRLLALPRSNWPKPELSVRAKDIRCSVRVPTPGERVSCEAAVRNTGRASASAKVFMSVIACGSDISGAAETVTVDLPPGGNATARGTLTWPSTAAAAVSVWIDLEAAHAYTAGYRTPVKERDHANNQATVLIHPPGKPCLFIGGKFY
jgi:hypothetical protein